MGSIQNAYGTVVGHVSDSGTIVDAYSRVVGRVSLTGEVTNASGQVVGYAEVGGSLYNRSRDYVGRVVGSTILNRNGSTIGMCDWFDPWIQTGGAAILLLLR